MYHSDAMDWTIYLMKRALAAYGKAPILAESKFSAEMLIKWMGNSNHRASRVQARWILLYQGQDRIGG